MPALIEGCPQYVMGSGKSPYELKNVGGAYSCTCPAWRNQGAKIDKRTCKHLRKHCGDAAEDARIGVTPAISQAGTTTGRIQTAAPNTAVGPATAGGRAITADASYAKEVMDRAASEGRSLRQDEKAKLHGPPVLLAHSYEDFGDLDPTGWLWSEKLDGVRAYWDGSQFVSRQGNVFMAPDWFREDMPSHPLDGELWMGRKLFQKTISVVKRQDGGEMWRQIKYVVFDMPHLATPFEERLVALENAWRASKNGFIQLHEHEAVKSRAHLAELLAEYEAKGAEGLMIRKPGALYEVGRSSTLLKVKPFKDAEAEVIGYEKSTKGQFKGLTGSLVMRMPSGVEFELNAGTTERRRNPPPVGTRVTYRYTELTDDGKPKCASFVAVRDYE